VFNCFKDFKAIVEKQSGYKIRTVRSDQGGENTANDFGAFLHNKASDIRQHQLILHG
jgi:hypothetical protein